MKVPIKILQLIFVVLILTLISVFIVKSIPQFSEDFSFVVYDNSGNLLNAKVSKDEQWRFPQIEKISADYVNSAIVFEDKNFYFHFGIDPVSVVRAIILNLKHKRIISGASTLTMQLARIAQKNKERTFSQKIKEAFLSLAIELFYSKKNILQMYSNNAPYGGNVVGISAASWRYFSRGQNNLSIAEIATLTVLPNDPSLVRPGLNEKTLTLKRNALLQKLFNYKLINFETLELAKKEAVPKNPKPIPNKIPHYAEYLKTITKNNFAISNIDLKLQERATHIIESISYDASKSGVFNAAGIIIENKTGNILAYIGNTGIQVQNRKIESEAVDIVQSKRSSGSLLKPFLYAASLDESLILPTQVLIDLPTQFGSYIPQNNTHYFLGAVDASEALTKSLNVPFVNLLSEYSVDAFLELLKRLGFTTFDKDSEYYGLPLILGGGEVTLYEVVNAYKNMALVAYENPNAPKHFPISRASCRITFDILQSGIRPAEEEAWNFFSTSKNIAWKTGTSYGNKDAWCVGVTNSFTVGVWFGNANGIGRPEITSSTLAAPAMFKLFELLPNVKDPPRNELDYKVVQVCQHSGFIASEYCDKKIQIQIPKNSRVRTVCPYCKPVLVTADERFIVSNIEATNQKTVTKNFFVLPPAQEYYYSQTHSNYKKLPPKLPSTKNNIKDFQIIFPKNYSNIYIPLYLDGSLGGFVAKVAYAEKEKELFWFLDENFLCTTKNIHEVKITTNHGKHILTVMDIFGNEQNLNFFVLSK